MFRAESGKSRDLSPSLICSLRGSGHDRGRDRTLLSRTVSVQWTKAAQNGTFDGHSRNSCLAYLRRRLIFGCLATNSYAPEPESRALRRYLSRRQPLAPNPASGWLAANGPGEKDRTLSLDLIRDVVSAPTVEVWVMILLNRRFPLSRCLDHPIERR